MLKFARRTYESEGPKWGIPLVCCSGWLGAGVLRYAFQTSSNPSLPPKDPPTASEASIESASETQLSREGGIRLVGVASTSTGSRTSLLARDAHACLYVGSRLGALADRGGTLSTRSAFCLRDVWRSFIADLGFAGMKSISSLAIASSFSGAEGLFCRECCATLFFPIYFRCRLNVAFSFPPLYKGAEAAVAAAAAGGGRPPRRPPPLPFPLFLISLSRRACARSAIRRSSASCVLDLFQACDEMHTLTIEQYSLELHLPEPDFIHCIYAITNLQSSY